MDLQIDGKVAYVAAATQGIGLATAIALAQNGCKVVICGRSESKFPKAIDAIKSAVPDAIADGFICDVSMPESIENWFNHATEKVGAPDILVTNTGGPPAGSWQAMSDEQWQSGVDSTLMNVIRMVRLATPSMKANKWGRIIHITSLVAKEPNLILPISSTLRAGLMALTRLQSTELAPYQITVNGILPGHTLTDRQLHLADFEAEKSNTTREEALANRSRKIPLGYIAQPEDIANPIAFLASHQARYITGTNLLVDGGVTQTLG